MHNKKSRPYFHWNYWNSEVCHCTDKLFQLVKQVRDTRYILVKKMHATENKLRQYMCSQLNKGLQAFIDYFTVQSRRQIWWSTCSSDLLFILVNFSLSKNSYYDKYIKYSIKNIFS